MFGLGSLDKEVPLSADYDPNAIDLSSSSKSRLLKSSVEGRTYPDVVNYKYMQGNVLNQGGYGICYIATACNFAKFVVWLHTGKKLEISQSEALDVAGDGQSRSKSGRSEVTKGGYFVNGIGLLRFNLPEWQEKHAFSTGQNECLRLFKQICDAAGINESNLCPSNQSIGSSKANCIKYINQNGPFYWGHHCCFYSANSYGDDNHAILGIGYDKDGAFMKGSWSSDSSYETTSYGHYFHVDWSDFEKYGYSIGAYNHNIWKKL